MSADARWPGRTGSRGPSSVTEDLVARFASRVPVTTPSTLVVTYVRAHHIAEHDPREFVLRPSRVWVLTEDLTMAFGRAPMGVDVAVPLVEEQGAVDSKVPRMAGRLQYHGGAWHLSNHSTTSATIAVSAPGATTFLSNQSQPLPLRSRRLTITVPARSERDGRVDAVEHRFTLLAPRIADDLPATAPPDGRHATVVDTLLAPEWHRDQQRLLAAWAYHELLGLAPRGVRRGQTTRLLLRQSLSGDDPNEKPLSTLRKRASRETGIPMMGEIGTPAFLHHIVQRRGYLGAALAELHAEYDQQNPRSRQQQSPSPPALRVDPGA